MCIFKIISRRIRLKTGNISGEFVGKFETHILRWIIFSRKSRHLWDNLESNGRDRQATDGNVMRRRKGMIFIHSFLQYILWKLQIKWLLRRACSLCDVSFMPLRPAKENKRWRRNRPSNNYGCGFEWRWRWMAEKWDRSGVLCWCFEFDVCRLLRHDTCLFHCMKFFRVPTYIWLNALLCVRYCMLSLRVGRTEHT